MATTANLSALKCVQFFDDASGVDGSAINIEIQEIAAQGCSIRAITVQTVATAGGAAVLAIKGGPTGATVDLISTATTAVVAAVGVDEIPLTATLGNLQLENSDILTLQRSGANSQNIVTIYFGDYTPASITVS